MDRGDAALGESRAAPHTSSTWWHFLVAYALYQALSLAAWWHLLRGFGSALPSGSADPGQEVWFLAWVPHALGAGTNPFFSHALFAPQGVNMLSNTSIELLGLLLAPVTITAGPVAALDVAVLLAPALSALGAFALCRRFVRWRPAAFVGGLCYGFGPFLATDLRFAHVDLTWLVLPPLIFLALHELLTGHRPLATGAILAVLVIAQFFVSTEMLAITALVTVVGVVVAVISWPRAVLRAARAAGPGIALAVALTAAVLAYPMWVVVAGPRHNTGPVWPHIGRIAASLAATIEPHAELAGVAFVSGGDGSYLGVALLVVLVAGALVLWRSTVLRLSLGLAAIAYVASLGYHLHVAKTQLHVTLPAAFLAHVPLLDSIVPERGGAVVDLFCGLALAVVVDHVARWERPPRPAGSTPPGMAAPAGAVPSATGGRHLLHASTPTLLLALAVAAFALVPLAVEPRWPYATTGAHAAGVLAALTATASSSTTRAAGTRAAGTRHEQRVAPIVAVFPGSPTATAREMVAQADSGFSFSLPDGYAIVPGAGGRAVESPAPNALWLVFAAATLHRLEVPLHASTRRAVHDALDAMGVSEVVALPHEPGSAIIRFALGSVLGQPSGTRDGAAVWTVRP